MVRLGSHLIHSHVAVDWYLLRYFSEKLWDPYLAGSVPIFVGATVELKQANILPEGSWIDASDFSSPAELAQYLHRLASQPEEYQKYFEWKDRPLPEGFSMAKRLDWGNVACNLCTYQHH